MQSPRNPEFAATPVYSPILCTVTEIPRNSPLNTLCYYCFALG
jgi:hypothetical protein